jgi:hypothetical protein
VGRHAADDGAAVDPIVAAALQWHTPEAVGVARHAPDGPGSASATAGNEGDLGWPGPPADGTGLGWPADAVDSAAAADEPARPATVPAPRARRRPGWRRFFGGTSAPVAEEPQNSAA